MEESIYLIIAIVLVLLAVSDLIVGVSNDAVNFLNSALGSKVAPLRVILIVAAVGVVFGATSSSGMMEVARSGIFNPQAFYFSDVMLIFLAVMTTDIILLDLFNTFGLPTSTTVSVVSELLGAAVAVATVKIVRNSESLSDLPTYINSGKVLAIFSAILVSVVISFTVGAIVQYFSRLLFTFNYNRTMKYYGAVWGGIALTSITYFILIKGAHGFSFLDSAQKIWLDHHTMKILIASLVFWSVILQIFYWLFKINILRFIVLSGTFALAMAFAGNDLVNFIGVPLAGLESFITFHSSGASPDGMLMTSLQGKIPTPTMYLLIAGLIMVITLWLSKKAKSVVKTTLDLSDQEEINERFESSMFARTVVRETLRINKLINRILPPSTKRAIELRFDSKPFRKYVEKNPGVSFDLIRASVILVVSAILIALGTSMTLPLSTTYVTFMVAMGTSLADGAWGRESAVYRITGVVTVISGWFFTFISAFTLTFIIALIFTWTSYIGMILMLALAIFIIVKTHVFHNKKLKEEKHEEETASILSLDSDSIYERCSNDVVSLILAALKTYNKTINGLIGEKRKKLREDVKSIKYLLKEAKLLKKEVPITLQKLTEEAYESGHYYIEVIDHLREMLHCVSFIVNPAHDHVDNNHSPLNQFQTESLQELSKDIKTYVDEVVSSITKSKYTDSSAIIASSVGINEKINKIRKKQLKNIKKDAGSTRTNMLFLDILGETKGYVLNINGLYKSFQDFAEENKKKAFKKVF